MAVFYVIMYALEGWYWEYYNPLLKEKLTIRLHKELFQKAQTIDIACYDDPEFYNDFVWAMDEAGSRANDVMADLGKIVNRLVAAGTLFTLMFSIDTWISVALFVVSCVSVVINQIANKLDFEREKEFKPLGRVRSYINRVFHLKDYDKEIRISHVTDLMMDEMDKNTEDMVKTSVKFGKKYFVLFGICYSLLSNIVYFGVLFYMFYQLIKGNILIGGFAVSIDMVWRVRWMLEDLVERMTKFRKHSLFLEKYYGFLAYKPKIKSGGRKLPRFESLEVRDVSFTYDFSDNPVYGYHSADHKRKTGDNGSADALKNVNMTLKRGEKIAIVGYNGAGKTTLIKLLMRLYDPTSGQILLNGTDVREFDVDGYRDKIGTVFQDYKIFAASVAENVMNGDYEEAHDKAIVTNALDAAGFGQKLETMEKGVDTVLTREFDEKGTELSGGESQKVAIARVFAKPYELIIMDEPSSALDPIAEYELNRAIAEYAKDKTVIFISHRLSTTRSADRIYMFDSGRLVECGSHGELMHKGGKYAEMFNLQAEKYSKH
jgi:ATP-binding cassette subfamily B protein